MDISLVNEILKSKYYIRPTNSPKKVGKSPRKSPKKVGKSPKKIPKKVGK